MIDIHMHTVYSDGDKTVEEVLKMCKERKLEYISITDHDTCKQYDDETFKKNTIFHGKIIKGTELHAVFQDKSIEILAYNINPKVINEWCEKYYSEDTLREQHHIYGAEIAEQLLLELDYPKERIEKVKNCVLNHRGSKDRPRNTIEEQCVADADVIAHFDCIPSLFSLVYKDMKLSISDGTEYVRKKLERDYNKLSPKTKTILEDRYKNIIDVLFVN